MVKVDVVYIYNTHTHIYIMKYYSAINRNEILPFATTWVGLEGIVPCEMLDKDKYSVFSLICGLLKVKQINITKQKHAQTHRTK